jgi:hypothetical protein
LFGLTIDETSFANDELINQILVELTELSKGAKNRNNPLIVRFVIPVICKEKDRTGKCTKFDDNTLDKYARLISQLKKDRTAKVMAEILDSDTEMSKSCFIDKNLNKSVNNANQWLKQRMKNDAANLP